MTEEMQTHEVEKGPKKRNIGRKKGGKARKKIKMLQGSGEKVRIDKKMKKLFQKRARDYNSDDDESAPAIGDVSERLHDKKEVFYTKSSDEEEEDQRDAAEEDEVSGDEEGELQPGITKFIEGCKAFRMAFKKIVKTSVSHDVLGPILSAQKKLVAEKLAEDEAERKVKGEAKKEKHLVREKGHVKPANYLDSHEKFLIGVATKGVVKLFNAVNKAQNAQKGLNPSRFKDEKVLRKRRKEAFISELRKPSSQSAATVQSGGPVDAEGPGWAPLRDNYMLTNSKLKNWDKMPDATVSKDFGMPAETSSDED